MASTSSQASTRTSTSPSPSLFPQPSTTNNTNNANEQSMSGILGMNASPPLVAAFLGIGLFTMIMMIVFAWRRINRGRLLVHPIRPAPRTRKKPIVLGEKPELWDVWTRREEPEARDVSMTMDMRWENITPFSATLFCPIEPEPTAPSKDVEPRSRNLSRMMSAFRLYLRPNPLAPASSLPESPAYELDDMPPRQPSDCDLSLTKDSSVVMSFTIAMPFPERRESRDRTLKAVGSETFDRVPTPELDMGLGEYCIGSVEVLCHGEDR